MRDGNGPCYPCRVSTHLSIALLRFCLVGLMTAARLLCPCPAVAEAHAAHPQPTDAHSCCEKSKTGKPPAPQQTDHSHGDGCQHCPDSPQLKPAASEGAEQAFASAGGPLAIPDLVQTASALSIVPRRVQSSLAAHPPHTLLRIRTVVLLI